MIIGECQLFRAKYVPFHQQMRLRLYHLIQFLFGPVTVFLSMVHSNTDSIITISVFLAFCLMLSSMILLRARTKCLFVFRILLTGACVAQRPCSRCLSNGKEDTCIDVQHKKRGRPRLRDERESRYEGVASGYPSTHQEAPMRRPLSLYSPNEGPSFSDIHRSNSYRVLKSQGGPAGLMIGGTNPARYIDHASRADANIFGQAPSTPRTQPMQEPACAYLNMEMQIVKATSSFSETLGLHSVLSRKLQEIVSPVDQDKLLRLQRGFEDERREREPNYLPPIYLAKFEEDRAIQSVGFSPEEIGQARTNRQEMLTFQAPDGQQRTFQLRLGLAKKNSAYFMVALLSVPAPVPVYQPPSISPFSREINSRDSQYGFQNPSHGYGQTPGMSSYAMNPGFGDPRGEMTAFRNPGPLGQNIPSSSAVPQYAQLQARPEYAQVPYQTPRSEIQPQARQDHIQLPPIRAPSSAMEPVRRRDDRSGRVDIGGLLEKPDPNRRRG